jgi:hypothetical protein
MPSGLDVNNHAAENMHSAMGSFSPHEHYTFTNSSDGVELVGTAGDLHLHHQHIEQPQVPQLEQQRSQEASYPSPTSTISTMSPGGSQSPRAQAGSAPVGVSPSVPISTSSELAFALENKSEQQVG